MAIFNPQPPSKQQSQNPFSLWQKEMSDILDQFNHEWGHSDFGIGGSFIAPRVEIKESDKNYIVKAEIPGMRKNEIQVSLLENHLILKGERKSEFENVDIEKGLYSSEFEYGSIYRSIPFQSKVNPESLKSSYRDGILTVNLDKLGM